jgi:hypothetical protein
VVDPGFANHRRDYLRRPVEHHRVIAVSGSLIATRPSDIGHSSPWFGLLAFMPSDVTPGLKTGTIWRKHYGFVRRVPDRQTGRSPVTVVCWNVEREAPLDCFTFLCSTFPPATIRTAGVFLLRIRALTVDAAISSSAVSAK